jgi:hypothetical protein
VVFGVEQIIKIFGLTLKKYLEDNYNLFDLIVAIASYIEFLITNDFSIVSSIRVIRFLRLIATTKKNEKFN